MNPEEIADLFNGEVPIVLLERMLRAVFAAHRLAFEDCSTSFEDTELENVLPYHRRARIEQFIRDAAGMVPGVDSRVVKAPKSNWNHTEVSSGRVILTASSVQTPCGLVEPAEFRQTLARSGQYVLWPEPGDEPDESAPLYAVLLHGKSTWKNAADRQRFSHLPGSAYIAIPSPDLKSYVYELNLIDLFPDVVESNIPNEWNESAKVSYLSQARKIIAS